MVNKGSLIAALAATTILAGGVAVAQTKDTSTAQSQQATAIKDFSKLSTDGSRGYQDLVLTRLAIFDGRVDDAKKAIADADASFDKAKGDQTVFSKAEADMKTPADKAQQTAGDQGADKPADKPTATGKPAASQANGGQAGDDMADMKTPKSWLPVDGEISVNEDYTADKTKSAAMADANKSLASGDRKGAIDKLKLAGIDMDVVLAVVPVAQTIQDVHQAKAMIDDGKFYEASQLLRKVQDSTRFDIAEVDATPKGAMSKGAMSKGAMSKDGAMTGGGAMKGGSSTSGK